MKNKKEEIQKIANAYAWEFSKIIGYRVEFWVGDGAFEYASFGDCYFFDIWEIAYVVDNIDKLVKKFGSKEAVGKEIIEWVEWLLEGMTKKERTEYVMQRATLTIRPNINLRSWLDGAPRVGRQCWLGDEYVRLSDCKKVLNSLVGEYGRDIALGLVKENVAKALEEETKVYQERLKKEFESLGKVFLKDIEETTSF